MMKRLVMLAAGCLSAITVWGRSFSIDLRPSAAKAGVQVHANAKRASKASAHDDGALRRVNLDAGAADVGKVAVGDELAFTLFDDVAITLTLKKQMPSPLGGDVFLAEASGYEGVQNAVVLRTADGLAVDVQDYRSKRLYKIISAATGVKVEEIEPKAGRCGCDTRDPPVRSAKPARKTRVAGKSAVAAGKDSAATCVDILVAYDRNAATWANANGGVTNFATIAVQKMNTVLVNSGLSHAFQFRLVGVVCVDAAADDLQYALDAATQGTDGWAPIKIKRDEVYADIVSVLVDSGDLTGTTGVGWSLKTSFASFSEYAYNVCEIRAVDITDTMTHEVGHNMGAGHSDIQSDSPGPQYFSYSAGYYFSKGDAHYHTIMAYDSDGISSLRYSPVPYFSTPDITFEGVQVGDATHDNAKTLLNTFATVAMFRSPPSTNEEENVAMPMGSFFGFEWRTSKSRPWTNYDVKYPAARYAARLYSGDFRNFDGKDDSPDPSWDGPEPDAGSTWLETTVVGPARMSFFHSVYMANGPFTISVDGMVKYSTRTSNTDTFLWADVDVPEGEHDVRLTFVSSGWFCGYDTFNGIELYDVRIDTLETRPVITPASSYAEENATTFWESCEVTITNAAPGTTIYYTLDDKWPNVPRRQNADSDEESVMPYYEKPLSECSVYTGPFTVTNSVVVKAVAVQADGSLTMTDVSLLLQRRKVRAGEWTTDAVGAVESAAEDGRMVLVRYARSATKEFSGRDFSTEAACRYVAATESEEFLSWAKNNGIYLVEYYSPYLLYTRPRHFENAAASRLYTTLRSDTSDYPALVFSNAWMPYAGVGKVDLETEGGMVGSVAYDGTAASIIKILGQYLEERPGKRVTVTLNPASVGELKTTSLTLASGGKFGKLPVPQVQAGMPSGYRFTGWYATDNGEWLRREWYSGCSCRYREYFLVREDDLVPYSDVTLVAEWKYDYDDNSSGGGSFPGGGSSVPTSVSAHAETPDIAFAKAQTFLGALYGGDVLVGTVQVKAGKINARKGTVKFSATATLLQDGKVKKVTAKAVELPTSPDGAVSGTFAFKAPIGEMAFEMASDGTFALKNASYVMADATVGSALKGGARGMFRLAGFDLAVPGELQDDLLPREVAFGVANGRWQFAKGTTVKWAKDRATGEYARAVDESNGKTNRASLKLSYTAKTGIFKGSFKAYALEEKNGKKKLAKYTVNVIGLVVDGIGQGEATCKKPVGGPWPVTVE